MEHLIAFDHLKWRTVLAVKEVVQQLAVRY